MLGPLTDPIRVAGYVFVTKLAYELYYADWTKINARAREDLFNLLLKVPHLGEKIEGEIGKKLPTIKAELTDSVHKHRTPDSPYNTIDHEPMTFETLMDRLQKIQAHVPVEQRHKISGAAYISHNGMTDVIGDIAKASAYTNPLHPDVWPGIAEMNAQIINCAKEMFNAPNPAEGFGKVTSGGTMSIFEAVRAYRNRHEDRNILMRAVRAIFPAKPEIIVPSTVHAAFEKAADNLGCKLVTVPVDPVTQRADVKAMEAKINHNTMMMVGSLPSYPSGALDDIEALGKVAQRHHIGLHVDACLGGFVVPFLQGEHAPDFKFGFDAPGVSSISLDSHKYGQSDKGASIILYRSFEQLGKYQTSTHVDWSGGLYATPGLDGSASGYAIASTWAMMHHVAAPGYTKVANDIAKLAQTIKTRVEKVEGIDVMGCIDANVVGIRSKDSAINIHLVVDQMTERGWHLNTLPNGFHFCLTQVQTEYPAFLDEFMRDLKDGIAYARQHADQKPKSDGAVYGATKSIPSVADHIKRDLAQDYLHKVASVPRARLR